MNNRLKLLFFLAVCAVPCLGQNTVTTVPGATISVCYHPATLNGAGQCTNYAPTYTDSTLTTTCPSNAPITYAGSLLCVGVTDAYANFGFWAAPGCYDYTILTPSSQSLGPFYACGNIATPIIYAAQLAGATAGAQITTAVTQACAAGSKVVNLYGMPNPTISSTVSMGCPNGAPLRIDFDASTKFVPSGAAVDMFAWLPGAIGEGQLTADVTSVSGYHGKVLQLSGNVYDNQPGNLAASKAQTITPDLFVFGGNNTTGTCLYLQGTSAMTEYIEFVDFGKVRCSGMLWGVHAVTAANGWINANDFNVRCSATVHCFGPDTTDANGNFVGNTYNVATEFSTNFASNTLDGIWFKGLGSISNNIGTYYSWDFANCLTYPTCATVRVDASLAHTFGNLLNGQVDLPLIVDPDVTLNGYDTLTGESFGIVLNVTGPAIFPYFRASIGPDGYEIGTATALSSDGDSTIVDALDASGNAYLRTNNNRLYVTHDGNAIFSVAGVTKSQTDSSGNATFQGNGGFLGKLTIGGVDVVSSFGVIDAGKLGATTAHAPAASLGTGSPGATTALFGDQSYKQTPITSGTPVGGNVACWVNATTLGKCTVSITTTCTCVAN